MTDWITETRVLVVSIFEVATDHLGENGFEVNQMKLFFILKCLPNLLLCTTSETLKKSSIKPKIEGLCTYLVQLGSQIHI